MSEQYFLGKKPLSVCFDLLTLKKFKGGNKGIRERGRKRVRERGEKKGRKR
jgi:hypothetical protein